jgi:hypothetical protein
MTMNTRVHILDPVDPERLFLHILRILESDPGFTPSWERPDDDRDPFRTDPGPLRLGKATYRHVQKGDEMYRHAKTGEPILEDDNEYRTTLGQGLGCIWEVTYAVDGPLVWPPLKWRDDDDEPDPNSLPVHLVSANFDTAYGYRDVSGAGCADLHAFLLREIGLFIRDARWSWMHEEKGSWHGPNEICLRGDPDRSVLNGLVHQQDPM